MTTRLVEAVDLSVEIDARRLLDSVSVAGREGQVVGLIGPNGAGKTTLLRALAGLIQRSGGATLLDGKDLSLFGASEVARLVGYVSQVPPDTHAFSAKDVVMMGRYAIMGRFGTERSQDIDAVQSAMDATQTAAFADRPLYTLSGGERQRVFIARAYAQGPRVFLLDEPTANLDVGHQMRAMAMVRSAASRGVAVMVAVHDLELAGRYCDRLVLLTDGRVVAEGTPEEVLTATEIESAYGVRAGVYTDPFTGSIAISFIEPTPMT